jgi:hypothetical protein
MFVGILVMLAWCGRDGVRLMASGVSARPGIPAPVTLATAYANNRRDGWYANETTLTPANVGGGSFGKLYTWAVAAGRVNAQPLVIPRVSTSSGQRDLLIVTSMAGTMYAFDVNNKVQAWNSSLISTGYQPNNPLLYLETVGCVSTPVADVANAVVYAVCGDSSPSWKLFKISLFNGAILASTTIVGQVTGTGNPQGDDVIGGKLQFVPSLHLQRAALLMANGNIYIGFGSHADSGSWHGWAFAYKASDLSQVAVFCTTPSNTGGGLWGAGGGFSADAAGNLYVLTGNGGWDGITAFGESILKLDQNLNLLDWFTPANYATLITNDSDMSSGRAMLMSTSNGSTLLVGGTKDYNVYAVDTACMGHLQGTGSSCTAPQVWLTNNGAPGPHVGIYGGTFANGAVFVPNTGGPIYKYTFSPGTGLFNKTAVQSSVNYQFPGPHLSYSSNGANGGVLWAITCAISAESTAEPGTLRAFDPSTMSEIYNSGALIADNLGNVNKFNPAVVADGKVYVSSGSNVYQFGLGAH